MTDEPDVRWGEYQVIANIVRRETTREVLRRVRLLGDADADYAADVVAAEFGVRLS